MLILDTDHTRDGIGLYGQRTPLERAWCACQGCGVVLSRVQLGHTEWDQGMARAEAHGAGGRWRCEPDGVSRLYCPACQVTRTGGKFGWQGCDARVIGPGVAPENKSTEPA